ncbi:alpha/beta fold hydrolase [Frigoriflavimonas asaccharolytica]|uniref:Pimeloyl-ACP methyl ester carboxylesterase n=1 Tax=Frigoriflavimonas asaccharolytica TaxID=2735899 RepID=A0A8J8K9B6_9FLAO|nr:alpha/beta fold hydrolase [Frigoriflavimonas asaccharolytica]NRS93436.1 pimeloyl-ACP methyl ester carboxylesterase [Frigoriflavimonas asaccharolytica]
MLNFEIKGTSENVLVLLHGFMENLFIWEEMETELCKNFKLVKIDLPGHGKSENFAEIHTMELMAEKVNEVIDYLKIEKFHLLGHSMGGYVSLAFAEKFPEKLKSLTLFFSTYFADDEEKKQLREKSLRIIKENFRTYVNAGIPNFFSENEREFLKDKIDLAKEIALSTNNDGVLAAQKGMKERTDKLAVLENFEGKILVIAGKYDNAVDSEKTLKNLPKKKNVKSYLLDCGHNGHWEKPTICAAIINEELAGN